MIVWVGWVTGGDCGWAGSLCRFMWSMCVGSTWLPVQSNLVKLRSHKIGKLILSFVITV